MLQADQAYSSPLRAGFTTSQSEEGEIMLSFIYIGTLMPEQQSNRRQ